MLEAAAFAERLRARFPAADISVAGPHGEVGIVFDAGESHAACAALRDEFGFEQLIDVAGIDYLGLHYTRVDKSVDAAEASAGRAGWQAWRQFLAGSYPQRLQALERGTCSY